MTTTEAGSPADLLALVDADPPAGLSAVSVRMRELADSGHSPQLHRALADTLEAAVPLGHHAFPDAYPMWVNAVAVARAWLKEEL